MKINRPGRFQSSSLSRSTLKASGSSLSRGSDSAEGLSKNSSISLSSSASFIQELRDGILPQSISEEVRMDEVDAAKRDIREGKLGNEEDMKQAITALLIEL